MFIFKNDSGKTIIKQFRSSLKDNHDDAHSRLMSQYREAPQWWLVLIKQYKHTTDQLNDVYHFRYTTLFVVALVISLVVCHVGKLMPWYLLFCKFLRNNYSYDTFTLFYVVAVIIACLFVLPTGIVQAITNQTIGM